MFAGRAQHIDKVIEPELDKGHWVLCDRFTDATYAYQGAGREMGDELIASLETMVQGSMRPDLTLLLDIPVELGLERAGKRSQPDRFELEKTDFFNRVRQAYLTMAKNNPQRYKIIDASQALEDVQQQISNTLNNFWKTIITDKYFVTEASADLSNFLLPLPWQKELWLSLNDRIESQRLPHAIILNGLEGVGAEHLAYALAFRMLCSQVDKGIPCGQCNGCLTLKAGSHPDFYRLSPQEKSKFIKVDQIRKLCESVAKTSQQGGWKVAVIVPAESMNIASSNALLKSLEEPEPNTLIILVSSRLRQYQ